jgi:SAM-dependent methyltransferase
VSTPWSGLPPARYSDADSAALYDLMNAWQPTDDFYLGHVMDAESVLDVGCGTGRLLHRARAAGHLGRLCGVDPDVAALDRARGRTDIEWVEGTAACMEWDREFTLAVMAGNAFQQLVSDRELQASLAAIRAALADGGRFVFSTRNPQVRAWQDWNPSNAVDVIDQAGRHLRIMHHVESVAGDVVTFTETTATPDGEPLRIDRASLRFLNAEALEAVLREAGLAVAARYGDWSRGPLTTASSNIVIVARAA